MNWTNLPPFEPQYSAATRTDVMDCIPMSLCHIIYMMTGRRYSPRALAYFAKVTQSGSSVTEVLKAVKTFGLIPYDLWPSPEIFTWNSYYEPVPVEVANQAEDWDIQLIDPNLDRSPIWLQLSFPHGPGDNSLHFVAQINNTQYFDSEPGGAVKLLATNHPSKQFQASLKLIPKYMPTFVHIFNTNEYGLEFTTEFVTTIVRFTSEADAKEKLKNIGAINADGSIKYSAAKDIRL